VTEQFDDLDEIENIDLTLLQNYIRQETDYLSIIDAIKKHKTPGKLPNSHPAKEWAGEWEKLSLLHSEGPIMYDSTRIVMPLGRQTDMVSELHHHTHGSTQRLTETLGGYCIWKGWKKDIEAVVNQCITCQQLQPAQSQGKPR
jgi:hypothetical protein